MIPTGVASVLAFLFFVVPGFVLEFVYASHYPSKAESVFQEITRVAILSLPFTAVSCFVLTGVTYKYDNPVFRILEQWVTSGRLPSGAAVLDGAVLAVMEVIIAGGLALLVARVWHHKYPARGAQPVSGWTVALTAPRNYVTFATVTLADGTQYKGRVDSFSKKLSWEKRELILVQPITIYKGNDAYHIREQAVTLHSSNIVSVASALMTEQEASTILIAVRARLKDADTETRVPAK